MPLPGAHGGNGDGFVAHLVLDGPTSLPLTYTVPAGNGPDKPVDSNTSSEGREKNRRTDIKVYPNPAKS